MSRDACANLNDLRLECKFGKICKFANYKYNNIVILFAKKNKISTTDSVIIRCWSLSLNIFFPVYARLLISIAIGRRSLQDQTCQIPSFYDERFLFSLDFCERVHIEFVIVDITEGGLSRCRSLSFNICFPLLASFETYKEVHKVSRLN
jgi:hypothetical protein